MAKDEYFKASNMVVDLEVQLDRARAVLCEVSDYFDLDPVKHGDYIILTFEHTGALASVVLDYLHRIENDILKPLQDEINKCHQTAATDSDGKHEQST